MAPRFRLPMPVLTAALVGLMALLATLQYKWLGRISDAERDRMRTTLNARASGFAQDFDGELTRAYLLFQVDPQAAEDLPSRVAARYDRWQATARYPRLIKEVYVVGSDAPAILQRFNPAAHALEPAIWPPALAPIRAQLGPRPETAERGTFVVRTIPPPVWDAVPALLIPTPVIVFGPRSGNADVRMLPRISYAILLLDRDCIMSEVLPALAAQHFRQTGDGFDYELAVVSAADRAVVYRSAGGFAPKTGAPVDASVDLFQIRTQDFGSMASEIRRFTSLITTTAPRRGGRASTTVREQIVLPPPAGEQPSGAMSIVVQQNGSPGAPGAAGAPAGAAAGARMTPPAGTPRWQLLVKHPSGSLESAVNTARRRNLIVSSSILAVLGVSMGLLVLSTRRAQALARQQMEFVATVSHELRTPLAVIRSAGENLADGVVHDQDQIRRYGDLVRNEGLRLSEMVEQILEFAGIDAGRRGFALRPVAIGPVLREILESSAALAGTPAMTVDYDIAERLAPVLGDEAALRRVFQNLVANAAKYGGAGGWLGVRARQAGREVLVTIADRGIGIAPAHQSRIFEPFYRTPDVVDAQIQGAGLGLSLVKRIVEAHGGRVTVHSAAGSGSEFTVILPAASEEPVGSAALSDAHGSRA